MLRSSIETLKLVLLAAEFFLQLPHSVLQLFALLSLLSALLLEFLMPKSSKLELFVTRVLSNADQTVEMLVMKLDLYIFQEF